MAEPEGNAPDHCRRFRVCADNGHIPVAGGRGLVVGGEISHGPGGVVDKKWFVVHAYSGFEKSVQRALKERIHRAEMEDKFGQILVPVEEVVEMKGGQKNLSERKFFPGYVLVEMEMTDETWHLVKNTAKVTGFIGGSAMKPTPISEKEVQNILHQIQEGVEKPKPKVLFEAGEAVRVKEGPFTDFHGNVEDVNYDKSKLRVSVSIFGRPTPVELDFSQVEKA
jgi:transcriptional antiterminator NusG